MNPAIFSQPFVQVTLPILVGFFIATVVQNRGFDGINKRLDDFKSDVNRRLDEITKRLDHIDTLFADHDQRITRLEERTSPISRR